MILAIDQGTTGTTVLIFDRNGAISGKSYFEFMQHFPHPGWVEHDAGEVWSVSLGAVEEAIGNAGIEAADITAVGITNQRETAVMWDRKTGVPVGRAIVWQDRRTATFCDELKAEGLEPVWQEKTGLLIDPYFSATKIHWMLANREGLRSRAENGEIAFGTIDSWLIWNLSGGTRHVTDFSNASRTMLYNIRMLDWDDDILGRLGIPRAILPEVVPSSSVICETDPEVFFGQSVPVAGVAGDQQSALFGHSCHKQGFAKNTYGTGSFMLMNTGNAPVASEERLLSTIAWKIGDKPVEYALEGSIFITGAAIQWLRDGLELIHNAAESEELARAVEDNGDVYFVPALSGLGAPWWDPYARGTIVGLTRGSTREHIVRAALESICYQSRDVADAMQREAGIDLESLRADGGAVANDFLMQFQADMLGVPVEIPQITETTALGAAMLAGLATGFWKCPDDLSENSAKTRCLEPNMSADQRDRLYNRWRQAVKCSMGWAR